MDDFMRVILREKKQPDLKIKDETVGNEGVVYSQNGTCWGGSLKWKSKRHLLVMIPRADDSYIKKSWKDVIVFHKAPPAQKKAKKRLGRLADPPRQ